MIRTTHGSTRRLVAGLAAAAALALTLSACGGGGTSDDSTGAGETGGASASDATTLIAYTGQAGDYQINYNPFSPSNIGGRGTIYEPLFFFNKAQVQDPVPLLGTEYSWNDDGTVLSVTLREGVTWSDGEPFTAKDVAFTFDLIKNTAEINSSGFDATTEAVDDTHVTFTFTEPAFVRAPDVLTQYIVPEHLWKDISPTEDVVENPIGTGPYLLGDFKPQAFTLVANEDYWGGAPAVKAVRYLSLSGNQAGADALAAGTIDWQTGPVPNIDDVAGNYPGYDSLTANQNQVVLATCSNPDWGCTGVQTDPAVRQALYWALDRDQINNLAFQGTASEISPTFALVPSQESLISASITDPVAEAKADTAKAAEVLEAAGYTKGSDGIYEKDGQRVTVNIEVVTGWTDYITAIDTITAQAKAAGIEVTSTQSSWNEWTDKKQRGNFQLAIDSLWQGPAPDPYYVYQYFFTGGAKVGENSGNAFSRYDNAEVSDAIVGLQKLNFDDPARDALFTTIQDAIVEDMPYVPVMTGGTTSEWNVEKFTGWPTEDDMYAFPAVWSALDMTEILKHLEPTGE
ncbi:MAG TPA: peptide ABC transporter substrate-binding protein [Micrococcales bacterium]|uniref:ABC transporter substrate-binding protein n=1 Tax=Miniimonas arenae TaxID=676201 RepID=UPI000EED62C2|nr:ABC transporter substrate-binding protein [Miniimonas arenae]HCX84833.1 peptide ABC transporter substrate-binding protein [Micrococcales bacterium]